MSRRKPKVIDHARDRTLWRALLTDVHRAIEAAPAAPAPDLAERALKARDLWISPAPYPCSLIAQAFTALVVAFVRQLDPDRRARIAGVLIECGALLDELLEAETPGAAAVAPPPEVMGRLPYVDA